MSDESRTIPEGVAPSEPRRPNLEDLERKKLEREIDLLDHQVKDRRRWFANPAFVVTLAVAVAGVANAVGQGYLSSIRSEKADLVVLRARNDVEKAQSEAAHVRTRARSATQTAERQVRIFEARRNSAIDAANAIEQIMREEEARAERARAFLVKVALMLDKTNAASSVATMPPPADLSALRRLIGEAINQVQPARVVVDSSTSATRPRFTGVSFLSDLADSRVAYWQNGPGTPPGYMGGFGQFARQEGKPVPLKAELEPGTYTAVFHQSGRMQGVTKIFTVPPATTQR